MLPLRARVDLGVITMKGYSAFPKIPALQEPIHQIVVIYGALCFDVAPGRMNEALNETRTHSYRFTSLVC